MKQRGVILHPGEACRRPVSDERVARQLAEAREGREAKEGGGRGLMGLEACDVCKGACALPAAPAGGLSGLDRLGWSLRLAFEAPLAGFGRREDVRASFIHLMLEAHGCRSAQDVRRQVAAMQSELDAYKAALDQHAIVAITDRAGRITHVNNPFCRISGYRREELVGQRHNIVNSRHHPRAFFAGMWRTIARGEVWRGEICNKARDGRLYWVDTTIVPYRDDKGKIGGYVSIRYDVTDRKQAEVALRAENERRQQAETLLRDVIDAVPDGIIAFDGEDRLVLFNEAYRRFHSGIAEEAEIGMSFEEMMKLAVRRGQFAIPGGSPADEAKWMKARMKAFRKPGRPFTQQLADGRWLQVQERRSASGNMVGVRTDITGLKRAELTIKDQAERDPLTGLYNRSVLADQLARAVRRARQGGHAGALVVADLDDFKAVNDSFGHDAGDRLLKEVARRLRASLRANDVAVRLGGDEFAFILPRVAGEAGLDRMLERVVAAIGQPVALGGRQVSPGCSLGVAIFPRDGTAPGTLMKNADIALYEAKGDSRGGHRVFRKGMRAAIEKRQKLAAALRADLAAKRLGIALQPQIRLADGAHAGFEVLARWSAGGERVPPPEFIRLAEETGMIVTLGEQVLEAALAATGQMRAIGLETGGIAVNVAAAQLKLGSFAARVEALLKRHGVAPSLLEIEITENVLLDRDPGRILDSLEAVKAMGIKVALDDFGTGFASLTHLKRFPVDRLKIDRSFVHNIETDAGDAAISRTIISLAHSLGLEVVAEGVETEAQLSFLRGHGCDYAQGFLFGRPSPVGELADYLARARAGAPIPLAAAE
ncbi:MAG: GGDEF domain-containing protein [Hyphomicrobiales bacterium]|nr:MAG: GGDEF domain-containing protein [Hyphomicrobiales bacterium]